ncbi:hypothetical protein MNBD_GAMMA15-1544 [hydrothermal vent metagenome]|uniref:Methyltransferase type 11 domain-containing protein n=1 Tax=hydrothermal vent metagenome TaxID=652676 RepID=A0A3B0XYE4_9ZZZZ
MDMCLKPDNIVVPDGEAAHCVTDRLYTQAYVLHKMGHLDPALNKCLKAVEADDNRHEAYPLLAAEIYTEKQNLESAYDILCTARQHFPLSHEISKTLGELCDSLGYREDAIALFSEVLSKSPDDIVAAGSLARIYSDAGEFQTAFGVWDDLVKLNRSNPTPYFYAASMFAHFKRNDLAESFLLRAEKTFPDHACPPYLLAAIRQKNVPSHAPIDYVRTLFDQFAGDYDRKLKLLENKGPELVDGMIQRIGIHEESRLAILDAGCGTGLCGTILSPYAASLTGVDLSTEMLEQARARGCYNDIVCDDLIHFSGSTEKLFDLVILSDVLVYFGDLSVVFSSLFRCLASGGHIIFTLEESDSIESQAGYRLDSNGRYRHTKDYILDALRHSGFADPLELERSTLRCEYGEPVGCLVVASGLEEE